MIALLGRLLALIAIVRRVLLGRGRGLPAPEPEADPSERRVPADARAEAIVAGLALGAAAAAVAFVVFYVVDADTQLLGLTAGLALALVAAALLVASLRVVPQVTEVEERAQLLHPDETGRAAEDARSAGEGISRRRLLTAAGGAAAAGLGAVAVVPIASLGPSVADRLAASPWRRGRLLVDEEDRPLRVDDLETGAFVTAFPQGADKRDLGSPVVVVRLDPRTIQLRPSRRSWAPLGFVAYSKICTHAGCAVSEFRYPLYQPTSKAPGLVCPCHYSTFDPASEGDVTFGPAGRPLPQLPLAVDGARQLRAAGPLSAPPGPAWWGVK